MQRFYFSFVVSLMLLISSSFPSCVDAKREMVVVDQVRGSLLPSNLRSAVIDTQYSAAYFATQSSPGRVCKYNTSSGKFSLISCIDAPSGVNNFQSAVIDTEHSVAYFGSWTSPGQVCKFNVSSANFSFVSCVAAASGASNFRSAAIDTQNSAAYFATQSSPGRVCKYNTSSGNFSFVSCVAAPHGANSFFSAVIDEQNSAAYFGTYTSPGQTCNFNISSANFSFVSCIEAPPGVNNFFSAVIDTEDSVAYFGSWTSPGQVCKFNVSSANFSFVSCVAAASGKFSSAVLDTQNSAAYFATQTSPSRVCKFNTSSATFSFVSCIAAPPGVNNFASAVIDTQSFTAYFGAWTFLGSVCKYSVSSADFSFVSCIEPPPELNYFESAVIDTRNSAAYFGSDTVPGRVCKFKISSANFSPVSCIEAPSGMNYFKSAVIDTQNSAAYFGTGTSPGRVCKYKTSSAGFSFVSCVAAPSGARYFRSAVIDTQNSAAYFGSSNSPGLVCKLSISPSDFRFVSCVAAPSGANGFFSSVIDTQKSIACFGTNTILGNVCNFNVSSSNFSFVSCIEAPPGMNYFASAVIDAQNSIAYFGARTIPGQVCKINVSSSNFSFVSCIEAPPGMNYFESAVIDAQNSIAYFGTNTNPGHVCKYNVAFVNFSCVSCIEAPSGANSFYSAVIDAQNSVAYFGTLTDPGQVVKLDLAAFGCNSDGKLVINQHDFSPSAAIVKFVSLEGCNVTMSSVAVQQPIMFLQNIGGSSITLRNITSASTDSLIHLASTNPFSSTSTLTFEDNKFTGNRILSSPSDVNLSESSWVFRCNKWLNGYNNALNTFASQHGAASISSDCPRTLTVSHSLTQSASASQSQSLSHSTSLSQSSSFSLNSSVSESLTPSPSTSASHSLSESTSNSVSTSESLSTSKTSSNSVSTSLSESVFCFDLNQQQCAEVGTGNCHFCSNRNLCVPRERDCNCALLDESLCPLATGCKYCSNANVCVEEDLDCECYFFGETACKISTCSWCDNYETCGLPGWDCDCTSLSNSSSSCAVNSNNYCKLCQDESVCVDARNFTCRCENFTQSVCDSTSSCRWCDSLNSCTLPENKNCTCNWLRFEDSCNRNSNNKCSWCATSSDTGTAKHNSVIPNFNYCINNNAKDQCRCSYLSPFFCAAANDPSLNQNKNLSTSCRFCQNAGICTHPGNDQCECGNFEQHACAATSLCTWKDPVLTSDGAVQYCSAASVTCSPVMCEGILTQSSCDSSGCRWNPQTRLCGSTSVCFNFFVSGFTPQPILLWVVGLLKDVLVVFLVGAYANTFTRPIMKLVTAVKKKVLKQTHIRQQMMEETVYMCDKHCRDDLPISFPQYVERVCESVFELENDDLVDEKNRRVLFDAVAYTLFDNMIWVDLNLPQKNNHDEELNFNKNLVDKNDELSQHEMKDLTVDKVDVKDEDQHEVKDEIQDENDRGDEDVCTSSIRDELTAEEVDVKDEHNQDSDEINNNNAGTSDAVDRNPVESIGNFEEDGEHDNHLKDESTVKKIFLAAQDFESSVTLTKKVDEALIERASAYVFYDQSRSRKVCAAASANTFPPALALIYYSLALLFLFVSSMVTVWLFKSFPRMIQSCDEFIPPVSTNTNTSDSNITSTTPDPSSSDTVIDGSYLTGAYFLLGFRLLNSSAFSTAILVFVKVVRGIYQRFGGIYTLSLQERIPLMALYSDRFTHVMLFLYALLVLPFALCGPLYGSSFGIYCWVPIFIAVAFLIGDSVILFVSRRFSSLKNRLLADEAENNEKQQALSKTFGALNKNFEDFLGSSPSKIKLVDAEKSVAILSADSIPITTSTSENEEKKSEISENLKENLLSYTPRQGDDDGEEAIDSRDTQDKSSEEHKSSEEPDEQLAEEVVKKQSSIESTSPVNLWNALLVFIMTEEIPVIVISLALQLSFNYAALLHYGDAFGLRDDQGLVYKRDSDSRSLSCIVSMFENDVSSFVSGLSSFVPFM